MIQVSSHCLHKSQSQADKPLLLRIALMFIGPKSLNMALVKSEINSNSPQHVKIKYISQFIPWSVHLGLFLGRTNDRTTGGWSRNRFQAESRIWNTLQIAWRKETFHLNTENIAETPQFPKWKGINICYRHSQTWLFNTFQLILVFIVIKIIPTLYSHLFSKQIIKSGSLVLSTVNGTCEVRQC